MYVHTCVYVYYTHVCIGMNTYGTHVKVSEKLQVSSHSLFETGLPLARNFSV